MPRSHERRKMLAELDSALRSRLLRLDEPIDRSDWEAVVRRSRRFRLSRYRSLALVAGGAAVLSLALGSSWARLFQGPEDKDPRAGAAPLRLALHLGDGSGLVLYSVADQARSLDNPARSPRPGTAAIVRSLGRGPFHLQPAPVRAGDARRRATDAPLPGDEALVSFHLFTTARLQTTAGAAVLTCRYGLDRNAYCNGAVELENGIRLTASGTLNADASHCTLVVTSSDRRDTTGRKRRRAARPVAASNGFERKPAATAIKVLASSRHSQT
jgi:hypothetical protein